MIGGGVAGLYAAWRLTVDTNTVDPKQLTVLEGSARTGGRLYTWPLENFGESGQLPSDSGLRAELGGMRFLNFHLYVGWLATHLNLPYVPFPADSPSNWHYLRTQAVQATNWAQQTVYKLAPQEQQQLTAANAGPGTLMDSVLTKGALRGVTFPDAGGNVTLRDMVNQILEISPLDIQGFWNLVVTNGQYAPTELSNEGYELFTDAGAYDTVPANWNATSAVIDMAADFATDPVYYALQSGYETLPDALAAQLPPEMVQFNSSVISVSKLGGGYLVTVSTPDGLQTITTDNVIFAVTPRVLQMLANVPLDNPLAPFADLLSQAQPVPLFKIFLVYQVTPADSLYQALTAQSSVWPQYTRFTTDFPMRQIYNFGMYPPAGTSPTGEYYVLLQASYSDGLKAGYWAGLMTQEPNANIDTDLFSDVSAISGTESLGTGNVAWRVGDGTSLNDHPLFSTVHQQFATLYGATVQGSLPDPIGGAAMDWATLPYAGGVNFWNVGVKVRDAYPQICNLVNGNDGTGAIMVVGEGYSLLQGWVEGALWSVEDAFHGAISGWQPPTWLHSQPLENPVQP
ncbi:MAG TPA: FAD-dependent oxidoreductase [Thermoanaerobaculia bacterium]|nr:FAD-dependent oxidoreductase [Thermoanaerobaculia bacterium]